MLVVLALSWMPHQGGVMRTEASPTDLASALRTGASAEATVEQTIALDEQQASRRPHLRQLIRHGTAVVCPSCQLVETGCWFRSEGSVDRAVDGRKVLAVGVVRSAGLGPGLVTG